MEVQRPKFGANDAWKTLAEGPGTTRHTLDASRAELKPWPHAASQIITAGRLRVGSMDVCCKL